MVFECTKDFWVDLVDDDGFTGKLDGIHVRKGSMWEVNAETSTLTGADIRLDELTGLSWLELSIERLKTHFNMIIVITESQSNDITKE